MAQTPKPKTAKLTDKQRKFVKAKIEGKSGTQAAMEAYNVANAKTASVIAVENLAKPSIQQALQAEFEKQGITLEAIVKPIRDGLTAEKVHIVGNGDQAMADVVPDHSIRLKASGMAAQFMGIGKNQGEGGPSIHFHQHVEDQRKKYDI